MYSLLNLKKNLIRQHKTARLHRLMITRRMISWRIKSVIICCCCRLLILVWELEILALMLIRYKILVQQKWAVFFLFKFKICQVVFLRIYKNKKNCVLNMDYF